MPDDTPFPPIVPPEDERPTARRPCGPGDGSALQYVSVLEKDFPRILAAIQSMWGYPELNAYFNKLTLDYRGDREGFPQKAWDEIFMLMYLHQMIVPDLSY